MKNNLTIELLFKKNIMGTRHRAIVPVESIVLGSLKETVCKKIKTKARKIHISTRALKHIYDKHLYIQKLPKEFDLVLKNLQTIVTQPDLIYKNKPGRKGNICCVKKIEKNRFLCSLEEIECYSLKGPKGRIENFYSVVSAFLLKDEGYLKTEDLLWSWEDGNPPS